jgi:hypothetical protein
MAQPSFREKVFARWFPAVLEQRTGNIACFNASPRKLPTPIPLALNKAALVSVGAFALNSDVSVAANWRKNGVVKMILSAVCRMRIIARLNHISDIRTGANAG